MAKSSTKLNILYGEGDERILASQGAVLQKAGHRVETAVGRKGVEEALGRDAFDLVILGPTLTRNDRHHLPYQVKRACQRTRVLVMHSDGAHHHEVDAVVETGRTIDHLVEAISSMMSKDTTAAL